jgi:hypothetical protein
MLMLLYIYGKATVGKSYGWDLGFRIKGLGNQGLGFLPYFDKIFIVKKDDKNFIVKSYL